MIISNSGNVGKTTITQQMLKPRLPEFDIIRVESLNDEGDATGDKISAENFTKMIEKIIMSDDILVDVGASNAEMLYNKIENEFPTALEDIDSFLIPVAPDAKQETDTINTINTLFDLGVDKSKIKVILNFMSAQKLKKADDKEQEIKDFYPVFFNNELSKEVCVSHPMFETPLFDNLRSIGIEYSYLINTSNDEIKELINNEPNADKKKKLMLMRIHKGTADKYQENLQEVFDSLDLV